MRSVVAFELVDKRTDLAPVVCRLFPGQFTLDKGDS